MYEVCEYVGGKIWLSVGESVMMRLRSESQYEMPKMEAMEEFLKPGMTFVDVGACMGYFSLYAAKLVGQHGTVIAIEPEITNCAWLQKSCYLNEYDNIHIVQCAAGAYDNRAMLHLGHFAGHHSLTKTSAHKHSMPVDVRTLDSIVYQCDAVKIDVEGSEIDVIIGGTRLLTGQKDMLLMMDLHPVYVDTQKVRDMVRKLGYVDVNSEALSVIARRRV
jgi:FkbM family methyltransferase